MELRLVCLLIAACKNLFNTSCTVSGVAVWVVDPLELPNLIFPKFFSSIIDIFSWI